MAKVDRAEIKTLLLPVKLTRDEVFIRGKELATKQQERRQKERELQSVIQSAKGAKETLQEQIDEIGSQAERLAETVRAEYEDRPVQVQDEIDVKGGAVNTIRLDSGEIVATRGITDAERQRGLFKANEASGLV